MGKKQGNASAKAAKKAKAALKVERKETKKVIKAKGAGPGGGLGGGGKPAGQPGQGKGKNKKKSKPRKDESDSDDDLEGILEKMRQEWEQAHTVTEELVDGPPSRRANATLTACPGGNHLWCIGGEFFSEEGKAYFYNDTFRYSPDKSEWRRFISPTSPGPRSAHAVVASPIGGGKLFLFGGEFSSVHQNSFHHYRDFWCFDVGSKRWERIETKVRPGARSGHRMAVWKHLVVLFGGFYDPGITTRYLNDLWVFDTQEYKWWQVEFREMDNKPSPRSGFSFLPCTDGIVLHGGYCKEYVKGKRPIGVMLEDTWLLKITLPSSDPPLTPTTPSKHPTSKSSAKSSSTSTPGQNQGITFKWEKRKRPSDAYAPSLRSGCTMALWAARGTGVMFGGVTDEDVSEEGLESVFWDDMYGYTLAGKGRWNSLTLKKPKPKGKPKAKKKQARKKGGDDESSDDGGMRQEIDDVSEVQSPISPSGTQSQTANFVIPNMGATTAGQNPKEGEDDVEDPLLTTPMPRYNAMLAVLRNTLYIYGGIFERGSREYTLDDFYSLQLDKMDRFVCLKRSEVVVPDVVESSSSSEDDEDDEEDSDDSEDDEDDEDEDGEDEDDGDEAGDQVEDGEDGAGVEAEADEENPTREEKKKRRKKKEKVEEEAEGVALEEAVEPQEQEAEPETDLRIQAAAFMGVSKDTTRSEEDVKSTPLPGETLAMFYARSREYWTQKAVSNSDNANRGKQLRRDGFGLAEERYAAYKPILEEVEKILTEAGLDEEEMRRGAAGGGQVGAAGMSRNRR